MTNTSIVDTITDGDFHRGLEDRIRAWVIEQEMANGYSPVVMPAVSDEERKQVETTPAEEAE